MLKLVGDGTSQVVQQLRISLEMQGTQVQSLIRALRPPHVAEPTFCRVHVLQ